jgi:hypothetical protein
MSSTLTAPPPAHVISGQADIFVTELSNALATLAKRHGELLTAVRSINERISAGTRAVTVAPAIYPLPTRQEPPLRPSPIRPTADPVPVEPVVLRPEQPTRLRPTKRDYNYFNELDAKLAELRASTASELRTESA